MARPKKIVAPTVDQVITIPAGTDPALLKALEGLGLVFSKAIADSKGPEKKNAANRKTITPWTPKNGEPKLKLTRKFYQHSIPMDQDLLTNEEIVLLNKLKPGRFLDNWLLVERRRDKGINITYPVKTPAQRMKLSSTYGIAGPNALCILLQRCIDEAANPKTYASDPDDLT